MYSTLSQCYIKQRFMNSASNSLFLNWRDRRLSKGRFVVFRTEITSMVSERESPLLKYRRNKGVLRNSVDTWRPSRRPDALNYRLNSALPSVHDSDDGGGKSFSTRTWKIPLYHDISRIMEHTVYDAFDMSKYNSYQKILRGKAHNVRWLGGG
jgi:hypothetical protein